MPADTGRTLGELTPHRRQVRDSVPNERLYSPCTSLLGTNTPAVQPVQDANSRSVKATERSKWER